MGWRLQEFGVEKQLLDSIIYTLKVPQNDIFLFKKYINFSFKYDWRKPECNYLL